MTNRSACRLALLVCFAVTMAAEVAAQPTPIYVGPPGVSSVATEINEGGDVAGDWVAGGYPRAFFWTAEGGMVDVGVLKGHVGSSSQDLNDNGQVVGASWGDGPIRAFSWTAAEGIVDLGTLGGPSSTAIAVNNRGQVVGYSETPTGAVHAFLWTATEGMIDLGTLGGDSYASGINESGHIVGWSSSFIARAFLWTPMSGMVKLASDSRAADINESGQIVGAFSLSAFSWTPATGLVTFTLGYGYTTASAVNERGQVVGRHRSRTGTLQAFSWTSVGGIVPLVGLVGATSSRASDVNDHGQIVGWSELHAVLWTRDGAVLDLSPSGSTDSFAYQLNNHGEIVGSVAGRAVLWRVPPPDGENLVVDGSFESGGTGSWFSDRAVGFTLDQNLQQRTGSYNAACWHPAENTGDCSIVQHVTVPEAGTYVVTIYAKADRPDAWVGANVVAQSGETQPFATPVENRSDYWGPDTLYPYFKYEAAVSAQAGDIIKVWGYSPDLPGWLVLDDVSIVKQ